MNDVSSEELYLSGQAESMMMEIESVGVEIRRAMASHPSAPSLSRYPVSYLRLNMANQVCAVFQGLNQTQVDRVLELWWRRKPPEDLALQSLYAEVALTALALTNRLCAFRRLMSLVKARMECNYTGYWVLHLSLERVQPVLTTPWIIRLVEEALAVVPPPQPAFVAEGLSSKQASASISAGS